MSKFILLTTHRSGTRLLLGSLGSQIQCHKRAFELTIILERFAFDRIKSPFYHFWSASIKRRAGYILHRKQLISDFLQELYTPADGVKAIGIRLLYEQADKHPGILEWAVENNVGIIHLVRENSLKAIVYTEACLKRGLFHSTSRSEPLTSIRLSPSRLEMQLTRLTKWIEKYRALLQDTHYLEVSYESLIANQQAETRRVLNFLGIDQFAPLTTGLIKRDTDSIEDTIENFEEVKRASSGTAFEKFFNKDTTSDKECK